MELVPVELVQRALQIAAGGELDNPEMKEEASKLLTATFFPI